MAGGIRQFAADVTTDASGDATAYLPASSELDRSAPSGLVLAVIYTKDDYAAGVDFTITGDASGLGVWTEANVNASKTVHPLMPASDQVGAALVYAAAGEPVPAGPVPLAHERLKIVIAQGGNAKTGNFRVILG